MMIKLEHLENISHTVTLAPRLNYSKETLDSIIESLLVKRKQLKKTNNLLVKNSDEFDCECFTTLELEKTIVFSIETLFCIQKRIQSVYTLSCILNTIPSVIPMLRTISAQLFTTFPEFSHKLCDISVHLGSIVFDSATLTKARFDFSMLNAESSTMLDEVKLIADSKINKQYPNLDFLEH